MPRSMCPVCGMKVPLPPKTRVTCLHAGTDQERAYVADIVTSVPLPVIDVTCVEEPLFETSKTMQRDDF